MATNNYSIKGIIERIGDTESKGANFQVRELVLRVQDGNYTQFAVFQLSQDRTDLAANFSEGQEVTIHFSLRGREWQGRYFTSLAAWKIVAEQGQNVPKIAPKEATAEILEETPVNENLDLPF